MEWAWLIGPAVVAAAVSGIVATVGFLVNRSTSLKVHQEKLAADQKLAERRFAFDKELAEQKFAYERQQVTFERRLELAEAWLADMYRFREIMEYVRNGVAFEGEGAARPASDDTESERIKRTKDIYFVPIARLQKEHEFIGALLMREHACQAHFGSDAKEVFSQCHQAARRVQAASETLISMLGPDGRMDDAELARQLRGDIWARYAKSRQDEDEVSALIAAAVATTERLCQPVLREGATA